MNKKVIQRIAIVCVFFAGLFALISLAQPTELSPSDSEAVKNTVAFWHTEYANYTQTVIAAGGPTKYARTLAVESTESQETRSAMRTELDAEYTQTVVAAGGPTQFKQTSVDRANQRYLNATQTVNAAGGPIEYQKTEDSLYAKYKATDDVISTQEIAVGNTLFAPTLANMATRAAAGEDPHALWLTLTPEDDQALYTATPSPQSLLNPSAISSGTQVPVPVSPSPTQPAIDWYQLLIIGSILNSLKDLPGPVIGLIGTIAGVLLTLTITNFGRLIGLFGRLFGLLFAVLRRKGKDYEFEKEYLNWLIGQYRYLGLLPAQVIARRWGERQQFVDLEQIYVQLSLSSYSNSKQPQDGERRYPWRNETIRPIKAFKNSLLFILRFVIWKQSWRDAIANSIFFFDSPYPVGSVGSTIDDNNRLILRGDPGGGKTTLMRYLAITCARALRNNRKEHDSRYLARRRLLWKRTPFPIIVRLSKHSDVVGWKAERTLMDAFKLELPVDLRRRCPDGFFERQLRDRPCLILLDAYDELGSPTARSAMAEYIKGFLDIYERPKHRIVVTTRIVGYEGQLDKYGFQIRTLQQLQDGEVRALVKQRYKAVTFVEQIGKDPLESRAIENRLKDRAQSLIKKIESNSRLRQLSSNPMLLSLIVLVHFLKVELPDERVLLYRDCVEILTERWQRYKAEESGDQTGSAGQDLNLNQKFTLLRELAYAMQLHRIQESNQALISRRTALSIISTELANLLPVSASEKGQAYQLEFEHHAEAWINGIQAESGILVEQGLDVDGEPLIGFSHLTFQEYLAALAISENPNYMPQFWDNLLNPAWREVVRLFVVLANDATLVIKRLLDNGENAEAVLLAGECVTERLRKLDGNIKGKTIEGLKEIFVSGQPNDAERAIKILGLIGSPEIIQFVAEQIKSAKSAKQVFAIRALDNIYRLGDFTKEIKTLLQQMLDLEYPLATKIAAREALAILGDPRFESGIPLLISVPEIEVDGKLERLISKIFIYYNTDTWFAKLNVFLIAAFTKVDMRFYSLLRKIVYPSKKTFLDAFEISRYPITNMEYSRFVDETGYRQPTSWLEGTFPAEKATHPVVGIEQLDTIKYCTWLSKKTGDYYRLPLRWEWEVAAGALGENKYSWGNEFDPSKCNTEESKIGDTTPVGIYFDVKSPYGGQDFEGNVLEMAISTTAVNFFLCMLCLLMFMGFLVLFVVAGWKSLVDINVFSRLLWLYGSVVWSSSLDQPNLLQMIGVFLALFIIGTGMTVGMIFLLWAMTVRSFTLWGFASHAGDYKMIDEAVAQFYESLHGGSWRYPALKKISYLFILSLRQRDDIGFRVVRQKR